jgi:hypothetical protein
MGIASSRQASVADVANIGSSTGGHMPQEDFIGVDLTMTCAPTFKNRRHRATPSVPYAMVLFACLLANSHALAQAAAPEANWNSFKKLTTPAHCATFAENAFRREHLHIWGHAGTVVLAGNDAVLVNVACVASESQTLVVVSAFSSDRSTAEQTRNAIESHIKNATCIDAC